MPDLPLSVYLLVALALAFDLLNGFHDSSNIVATMIFSRALSGRQALAITAIAEFTGPFLFGVAVATTLGNEVLNDSQIGMSVILAAAGRGHYLESDHVVARDSVEFVARARGRADRRGGHREWFWRRRNGRPGQSIARARHFSAHRISRRFSRHAGGPLSLARRRPRHQCVLQAGAGRYGGDACTFARGRTTLKRRWA